MSFDKNREIWFELVNGKVVEKYHSIRAEDINDEDVLLTSRFGQITYHLTNESLSLLEPTGFKIYKELGHWQLDSTEMRQDVVILGRFS